MDGNSNLRVLLIGATGMLGQAVAKAFRARRWNVITTTRRDPESPWYLDAAQDYPGLEHTLSRSSADWIVNCSGILRSSILAGQASEAEAFRVNAIFPRALAATAGRFKAPLLHISTDCVFSGRDEPYFETDPAFPPDLYGWSKFLGEPSIDLCWSVRCSIVGADPTGKKGLLEWYRSQPSCATVPGYATGLWHGVTTLQLARWLVDVIDPQSNLRLPPSPVIHLCPNPPLSRFDLLTMWREVLGGGATIKAQESPGGSRTVLLDSRWPQASAAAAGATWFHLLQEVQTDLSGQPSGEHEH